MSSYTIYRLSATTTTPPRTTWSQGSGSKYRKQSGNFTGEWAGVTTAQFMWVSVAGGFAILVVVSASLMTYCFSHRQRVKMSSWRFNILVGVGCILLIVSNLWDGMVYDGSPMCDTFKQNVATTWDDDNVGLVCPEACKIEWSLFWVAATFSICPIVLRLYRVHQIFISDNINTGGVAVTDERLLVYFAMFLAVDVVVIVLHDGFNRINYTHNLKASDGSSLKWTICEAKTKGFLSAALFNDIEAVWKGIIMLCGCYLIYHTQEVDVKEVNDTQQLSKSLAVACGILMFRTLYGDSGATFGKVFQMTGFLYAFGVVFIVYMLFKGPLGAIVSAVDSREEVDQIMDGLKKTGTKHTNTSHTAPSISDIKSDGAFTDDFDPEEFNRPSMTMESSGFRE